MINNNKIKSILKTVYGIYTYLSLSLSYCAMFVQCFKVGFIVDMVS